jgi:drug/metabolite transporter (DMT)-like permease
MNSAKNKTRLFTFLIILSMTLWGGAWVSAKAIATSLPTETLTFWRFFINFIATVPLLFFMKEPLKVNKSALIYILLGSAFMGLYLYLFFEGLIYGFAGVAGVIVPTMTPLVTFTLSIPIFGQKVLSRDLAGLALGIIGGSILLEVWELNPHNLFMTGNIYFLICAILWALLTICSQKAGSMVSPLVFSVFAYAFCSILFFFISLPYGLSAVFNQGLFFWLNILYLGIIASTFATTIYFFASSRLSSYRASSFIFLVPFSAVTLSWIFLGEVPKISTIVGGLTAIISVYLINVRKKEGREIL